MVRGQVTYQVNEKGRKSDLGKKAFIGITGWGALVNTECSSRTSFLIPIGSEYKGQIVKIPFHVVQNLYYGGKPNISPFY